MDQAQINLSKRWAMLLETLNVDSDGTGETYRVLIEAYSGPDRYYHNLNHLVSLLDTIDLLECECLRPSLVRLAGWFHDAIYDTRAADNEERSAVLAETTCASWDLSSEDTALVGRLIRATRTHQADDGDAAVLLDADLFILAAPEAAYDAYAAAIRQEYAWVPEDEFRRGRTHVLQGFLERERIFRLEWMHGWFEELAQGNLAREIEHLRG